MTSSLKGLKTSFTIATNANQDMEFFNSLIFFNFVWLRKTSTRFEVRWYCRQTDPGPNKVHWNLLLENREIYRVLDINIITHSNYYYLWDKSSFCFQEVPICQRLVLSPETCRPFVRLKESLLIVLCLFRVQRNSTG